MEAQQGTTGYKPSKPFIVFMIFIGLPVIGLFGYGIVKIHIIDEPAAEVAQKSAAPTKVNSQSEQVITERYLTEGESACSTRELLDELTKASVDKDVRALRYLYNNGCYTLKQDMPVSIIDRSSLWGVVKVRAYFGDDAIVLHTYKEAIREVSKPLT